MADSVAWVETAVTEFGVAGLSLRAMIDFLKTALGNSNAAVRTSATKALVTVKVFVGPSECAIAPTYRYNLTFVERRQGIVGRN